MNIIIARDFSISPGGRYKSDGNFSGELFREVILEPKFLKAKDKGEKLFIDLDGAYGYATTFLQESFGGLAKKYDKNDIYKILKFKSDEQPSLINAINRYIEMS